MHTGARTPEACENSAEWLAHIADMLGADASGMLALQPDGGHHIITNGLSERAIAEYRDYCRFDPLPSLLDARPSGRALVLDTTTHPAYVAQQELSADYLGPHGIDHVIATQWREPDATRRLIGVLRFRGSAPFSVTEGKEFERVIHHWRVGNNLLPPKGFGSRKENCRRGCDIAAQLEIPLVLVDVHLTLVWANPAAREECGSIWTGLFDVRTKDSVEGAMRHRLQELVIACLRQRAESEALVPAPDGTWFATASPLDGKPNLALLRLTAMRHFGHGIRGRLQRLFGLTPAEADMTALLAKGESLEAISEARGVSIDTVRCQLRTVFKKTGMHRQGELVCAVGRLAVG
jgi:DNA-binding CsgD family transcriptional regulator